MEVSLARMVHLEALSELFDRYRVFYKQASNLEAAQQFLQTRLKNRDSVILIASKGSEIMGFTQLYPSFSSVSMKPMCILNDLYVKESYRRQGVATALMSAAEKYARDRGAVRVTLATQISNTNAQQLYETQGYSKDEGFYHYTLRL